MFLGISRQTLHNRLSVKFVPPLFFYRTLACALYTLSWPCYFLVRLGPHVGLVSCKSDSQESEGFGESLYTGRAML